MRKRHQVVVSIVSAKTPWHWLSISGRIVEIPQIETSDEARAAERIPVAETVLGLASANGWVVPGVAQHVKALPGAKSAPGAARRARNEIVRYERFDGPAHPYRTHTPTGADRSPPARSRG
jgi:hypothetical protein